MQGPIIGVLAAEVVQGHSVTGLIRVPAKHRSNSL